MGHDTGSLDNGAVPGMPIEGYLFHNWVHGVFVEAPTTPSAQLTGAGNGTYLYNRSAGVVVVDGTALDVAAAADEACEAAGDIMIDTFSKVYALIAWKHPTTNVVALKTVPGTAVLTADVVAPTTDEIDAGLVLGSKWVMIGTTTVNRTGATTVTQSYSNKVRPHGVPA